VSSLAASRTACRIAL
jgi:hypothetical protein